MTIEQRVIIGIVVGYLADRGRWFESALFYETVGGMMTLGSA